VSYKIRKLRESKDLKQKHVADELNITESAYSKIERGITDPSIGRLSQIARILGVTVSYFFQDAATASEVKESGPHYGFASDIETLNTAVSQLKREVASLKKQIASIANHDKKTKK